MNRVINRLSLLVLAASIVVCSIESASAGQDSNVDLNIKFKGQTIGSRRLAPIHTIWKRNDLKPHRTRTFKLSKDPKFEQKFWDVIGLYLHPPEKALVLCCDEKTQCQALERSQPGRAQT